MVCICSIPESIMDIPHPAFFDFWQRAEEQRARRADRGKSEMRDEIFMLIANTERKLKQDQNDRRNTGQPSTDSAQLSLTERGGSSSRSHRSSGNSSRCGVRGAVSSGASSGGEGDVGAADVGGDEGRGKSDVGALIERRVSSVVNDSAGRNNEVSIASLGENEWTYWMVALVPSTTPGTCKEATSTLRQNCKTSISIETRAGERAG